MGAVKVTEADPPRTLEALTAAGPVSAEEPSQARATDAGREPYAAVSAATAPVAARIYAGISDVEPAAPDARND
ncbi:hypothetical protein BIV25_27620 [Streptomyces sp. MUSC 14]|nr:hypothetical protein BIV25_27620 [Streptomyces sp. MUSC 14]